MGLDGLGLVFNGEGGVDPEENLELREEIHEFLRPAIGLGALLWTPACDPVGFDSVPLTSLLAGSDSGASLLVEPLDSEGEANGFDRGGLYSEWW